MGGVEVGATAHLVEGQDVPRPSAGPNAAGRSVALDPDGGATAAHHRRNRPATT